MITSASNGRIRHLCELSEKAKSRSSEESFVCEGFRMFEEAPDESIKEIYVDSDTHKEMEECFLKTPSNRLGRGFKKLSVLKEKGIDVQEVSGGILKKVSDTKTPQGIVFVCKMPMYSYEDLGSGNLLFLENIQDPGNLGTMIRTAEGAGAGGIIMTKGCVDIFNPKVVRATMGSLFRVPFLYTDHQDEMIRRLKSEGTRIYAAALSDSIPYTEASYEKRCAFMIGNEGNGLSEQAIDMADRAIMIPMEGKLESLNAAVSAAILLYNAKR